ncbi:MAG: hypothetical protein H6926_02895 [Chromatiales bacterium]|nr:hypothetical protein [Chromatiales bacterium]
MATLAASEVSAGVILNDIADVVITNPGDASFDAGLGNQGFTPYSATIDLPGASELLLGVSYTETTPGPETKGEETKEEVKGGSVVVDYPFLASADGYVTAEVETKGDGETKSETKSGTEASMYLSGRLDSGAIIGIGGSYTGSDALTGWDNIGDIGYLGIAIEIDGTAGADLYGWVLLERTAVNQMTIYEWAYEDSGAQILAGAGGLYGFGAEGTSVAEPAVIVLLAAGGVAAARLRARRRSR